MKSDTQTDKPEGAAIPANELAERLEAFATLSYMPPPHSILQAAATRIKALEAENMELVAERAQIRAEALEDAAVKSTSFLVGDPANGVPLKNPMPHEIAEALRRLKDESK